MGNYFKQASLIPYLEPADAGFKLKISLSSREPDIRQGSPFPFLVVADTDPVARVVEAQLATDADCEIKPVFIFIQKDRYHFTSNESWPNSNSDIDQFWQRAFSFYSESRINKAIILADQIGRDSNLAPFSSLFYCKLKRCFFHPPCPQCGYPLDLCRNSAILADAGLQPYESSLKRYLFCPECIDSGVRSDFYVSAFEDSDPPTLKNQIDLIENFGRLRDENCHTDHFPCSLCANNEKCYGENGIAAATISAFSFYPFYMLMFEGGAINALDYLVSGSGASREKSFDQTDRQGRPARLYSAEALKLTGQTAEWSSGNFQQNMEQIRKEVKNSVFKQQSSVPVSEPVPDKKNIADILTAIMEKWRLALPEKPEEALETIIISPSGDKTAVNEIQEDLEETLILSAPQHEQPQALSEVDNALQQDLSSKRSSPDGADIEREKPAVDPDMLETVILSPAKTEPVATPSILEKSLKEDELEETINLKAGINHNIQKNAGASDNEKDWMTETVILRPAKKDRK